MKDSASGPETMPATSIPSRNALAGTKMPLGARRLLLIGGFCVPLGLLATPYMFGAQLLLVAGIAVVAVALAHQDGQHWFARWSRLATIAGAVWLASTGFYWLAIISAADSSAPPTSLPTILFAVGVGAFAVMAAGTIGGCVSRYLRTRQRLVA